MWGDPSVFVAFSADGKLLAAGGSCTTGNYLWDVATRVMMGTMNDPVDTDMGICDDGPGAHAFSPDGTTLAIVDSSGSSNGGTYLWRIAPGGRPRIRRR